MIAFSICLAFLGVLAFVWWTRWLDLREGSTIDVPATLRLHAETLQKVCADVTEIKDNMSGINLSVGLRKLEDRS